MEDLEKLLRFIESALRHADLPDNPGIQSATRIDGESVIGVELNNGGRFFVEVDFPTA